MRETGPGRSAVTGRAVGAAVPPLAWALALWLYRSVPARVAMAAAHAHARTLQALERAMGMPSEAALQARPGIAAVRPLVWVYANAHLSVLLAVVLALSLVRPGHALRLVRLGAIATAAAVALTCARATHRSLAHVGQAHALARLANVEPR